MPRDYSILHNLRGSIPDSAVSTFELLLTNIYDLNDQVQILKRPALRPPTIPEIEAAIQSRKKLNVSQFLGVLAQPQNAMIPEVPALPDVNDPLSQNGGAVRFNGVLYVFDGDPEPGTWVAVTAAGVIQDTRANRAGYAASSYANILYRETDSGSGLWYISDGTSWVYAFGRYKRTQSQIAALTATLGVNDTGLLLEVTDYDHVLEWTGAALAWGYGNPAPSGMYSLFETAPTTNGWQICDGSTVGRLNADGTTTNVTVPDVTTARYLKAALTSAAVAAASGTSANTVATNQATVVAAHAVVDDLAAGAGNAVFATPGDAAHASHNHTQDAHNHGAGTIEPPNKQAILYYRR